MVKIILEQADNGVIKVIYDDNINGAGDVYEIKKVYQFNDDKDYFKTKEFLYELMDELGIVSGNKFEKNNLSIVSDWGICYQPSNEEIDKKIKQLQIEIAYLENQKV